MKNFIARATILVLLFNSVSPLEVAAASRAIPARAGAPAVILPASVAVPAFSAAALPAQAKMATAALALPRLKAAAQSLPAMLEPQAPAAAVSAAAARDFNAVGPVRTDGENSIDASKITASGVSPLAAARSSGSRASKVPRPSPWARAARRWAPAAIVTAGAVALGWLAHATGQPELAAPCPAVCRHGRRGDQRSRFQLQAHQYAPGQPPILPRLRAAR